MAVLFDKHFFPKIEILTKQCLTSFNIIPPSFQPLHLISSHFIISTTMHTCGKCQAIFHVRKDYSKHQKRCIVDLGLGTKLTIPGLDQEITVFLNKNGLFDCHCAITGCPKNDGFSTLEGLKKHLHKRKTWIIPANVNKISYTFIFLISSIMHLCFRIQTTMNQSLILHQQSINLSKAMPMYVYP